MLRYNLKSALSEYESRTGLHLSYEDLAKISSVSIDTIKSLANRRDYNATLDLISKISSSLGLNPIKHFQYSADEYEDEQRKSSI